MTREQFLELLQDPSGLDRHSEADLALLSSRFPYCQPLHYLHLRKLSDEQSVHYPRHLKLAAAVSPDRKQLYHFLHPESSNGSEVEITEPKRLTVLPQSLHILEEQKETETIASESRAIPNAAPVDAEEAEVAESSFSANDILEQRLRELNLWQEVEQPASTSEAENQAFIYPAEETEDHPFDSDVNETEPEDKEARAGDDFNPSAIITEPLQEPAQPEPQAEEVHFSASASENQKPEEAASDLPSIETEKQDPLEELIREELLQTRLRNADYFAEQGIDSENDISRQEQAVSSASLNTISEEVVKSKPAIPIADTTIPEPEVKVAVSLEVKQDRGAHTFLDWLHRTRSHSADVKIENVTNEHVVKELPTQPVAAKEDAMEQPPVPTPPSVVVPPKAESGPGQVFNFSPPRTIYMRKSKAQPEAKENEAVAQPLVPARPQAESQTLSTILKEEEENPAVSPAPSEEGETPALPVRKPLADPASVLNDPPRPKVPSSQLIDNFIRQDPRITPNKSTFYSPMNMAKKSVQEPEDLVTETLAKVYAGQGNYIKAIQVYEKLRLKFPEKKLYFAALIQELKDKSNP
jgi:hypothetical protein